MPGHDYDKFSPSHPAYGVPEQMCRAITVMLFVHDLRGAALRALGCVAVQEPASV